MPTRSLWRCGFDGTSSLPPAGCTDPREWQTRLLPAAAGQMACDAAGRKYSRPPPRQFWTTGAFLVAECGLCGARAVNGIYRGKPGPAPFGTWCHEWGQGSPYQNSVRDGGAAAGPAGR